MRQTARNAYAELLRDTRGLQREQQQARDAWFSSLPSEKKEEALFELEILLKGLACFANPRNHPQSRGPSTVGHDFHPHLLLARAGMARIVQLSRAMLGDRDRAVVFQRYLETVLPEDTARTRLLHASMNQETPEASLFVLRHGFTNLMEITGGLLRLPRVNYRLFYSLLAMSMRETAKSAFFNPLSALEFRPEFDRIPSAQVLELIQSVPGEQAHRLIALSFLSLFRMLRYLRLLESIALDPMDKRIGGRAMLVLAVLRSDARALSSYLTRRAGNLLANSYERDLLAIPATELAARNEEIRREGHRLLTIKGALTGVAANLRLELRRTFDHDLPAVDNSISDTELRQRLRVVTGNLRPALQNGVLFLAKSLGMGLEAGLVFDDKTVRRTNSERLRRDVWMFAQIARAFAHKARHSDPTDDRWEKRSTFAFIREFLAYFRAMGYPLLRVGDYPRFEAFMSAMAGLSDAELVAPDRLQAAIVEAEAFHDFLVELFARISERDELADVPFDKGDAARALRLYLGDRK